MINALLGAVYNQNEVVLQTLKDFIAYLDEENVFGNLAATYDELYLTPTELDCENIKLVALFLAFDDLMDQDMMDALSGVIDSWAAQMSEHPLAFTSSDIQALADDLNQFLVDLENADVVFAGIDSSNYETVESSVADPYFNQILDDLQMLISYLIGR